MAWLVSMIPINDQVTGEEEYSFRIEIDVDGNYVVYTGSYAAQKPRSGKLTAHQASELQHAVASLGTSIEHPGLGEGQAFEAKLIVGEGEQPIVYRFWEGALEEDEKRSTLVRQLEVI
jgi:hypothetical protein